MYKKRKKRATRVSPACDRITKDSWNYICDSEYPSEIKSRYGDTLLETGEPYSTYFMNNKMSTLLVIFRTAEAAKCETLDMVNSTAFNCYGSIGEPRLLNYEARKLTCVDYYVGMADDLVAHCSKEKYPRSVYSALFYTSIEEKSDQAIQTTSKCSQMCSGSWMLLLVAILLLFCILRWH